MPVTKSFAFSSDLAAMAVLAVACGDDGETDATGSGGASTGPTTATSSPATSTSTGTPTSTSSGEGGSGGGSGGSGGSGGEGGASACTPLELGATSLFFDGFGSYGVQVEVGAPIPDVAKTRLTLELYEDPGAPALETGTFDLTTPPNDDYGTCQHCVLLVAYDGLGLPTRAFFQTSGEIELTDLGDFTIFAGGVSGVLVKEVTQAEDGTWSFIEDGPCFTVPTWDWDTNPVMGGDCQRGEDCPNEAYQICDPETAKCAEPQCDLNFDAAFCDEGFSCWSQLVPFGQPPAGPAVGACYANCDPDDADACGDDQICYAIGPTQQGGICLRLGDGEIGEACDSPDISTGCVAGGKCDGEPGVCKETCRYLTDPTGCDDGSACMLDNVCRAPGDGDEAAIDEACALDSPFLGDCGLEGDSFRGLCISFFIQDPLECERICRTDDPECPDDGLCIAIFDNPTVGICHPQPVCGDGLLDVVAGEQCDDGNEEDGDGCDATCTETDIEALCGTAPLLDVEGPNEGTNIAGPSGYVSACDPFVVMPTATYAFTPPALGTLSLAVEPEGDATFAISVLSDCRGTTELDCVSPLGDRELDVQIAELPEEPLLVVVRGSTPLEAGDFTLTATFTPSVCGDGEIGGPEVCDDGNEDDGDTCSADCSTIDWELVCDAREELVLGETISDTTVGGTEIFDTGGICATQGGGGEERAYRFVAPSAGDYVFTLTQPEDDFALWIGTGCEAASWETFQGCGNAYWEGEDEIVYTTLEEGQELTLVVEGMRAEDSGPFSLTVEIE